MKVSELIDKLSMLPRNLEVRIFDPRKNLFSADEDGSGRGIDEITGVGKTLATCYETGKEEDIVMLSFQNDDYTEDGGIDHHSDLAYSIGKSKVDA